MNRSIFRFAIVAAALGLGLAAGCSQRDQPKRPSRKPRRPATRLVTRSAASAAPATTSARPLAPATASAPARRAPATTTRATMRRVHLFISGRVQGVGFRAFTRYAALELKVTGWVKNLPDKRVEAVIEGPADKVAALIETVRKGPPRANVTDVQVIEEKHQGEFETFEVRF